jgi:apolipoprotein N-acyltransferase
VANLFYFYTNLLRLKKIHPLFLSILSGLLLFAAWPVSPLSFLIFIAWVPLLWLEDQGINRGRFFGWTYLTLFVWNSATTWWMLNSTIPGGIAAILANSLLMCIPWIGFYNIKKRLGPRMGYLSLIVFWLSFEYIHLNWELSWPWLTIGNVFAMHPNWVQWYEYSGTTGGSLWVLFVNLLLFKWLRNFLRAARIPWRYTLWGIFACFLPLAFSYYLLNQRKQAVEASASATISNIVIVQPNIDPWDEKFVAGKQEAQLQKLIQLSESRIDSNTSLVIWPETAVPVAINEDSMRNSYFMLPVWDFLKKYPNLNLLTGIEGFRFFTEENKTVYSQKIPQSSLYAEEYNSAVMMDSDQFQAYHKSKLVPGVETLPSFLKFMESWFEKFGGSTGGYARQKERTVLRTSNNTYLVAPAVCYESIYGSFIAKYVRNGANLIAVITNDGWWGNTPGYKQHEQYARLRAIETRRWVARSANTGISCFIDPTGKLYDAQPWNQSASIKMTIPETTSITFYVAEGDLLSMVAMVATVLVLVISLFYFIRKILTRG